MPSILAVPKLESNTTPQFRWKLYQLAERNGWDVDAIATTISGESGFEPGAKNPYASASGLLQWIDSTARNFFGISSADIRQMPAISQLDLVERYYQRLGANSGWRDFDYYLVGLGKGRPSLTTVLFERGDGIYELNTALDKNSDGRITVSDIQKHFEGIQAKAGGRRVEVEPVPLPLAPQSCSRGERYSWLLSEVEYCGRLEKGSQSPDVAMIQYCLNELAPANTVRVDGIFGSLTKLAVQSFQQRSGLLADGIVGPKTWKAIGEAWYA